MYVHDCGQVKRRCQPVPGRYRRKKLKKVTRNVLLLYVTVPRISELESYLLSTIAPAHWTIDSCIVSCLPNQTEKCVLSLNFVVILYAHTTRYVCSPLTIRRKKVTVSGTVVVFVGLRRRTNWSTKQQTTNTQHGIAAAGIVARPMHQYSLGDCGAYMAWAFEITAAQQGHQVALNDRDTHQGVIVGQFRMAKRNPGKYAHHATQAKRERTAR